VKAYALELATDAGFPSADATNVGRIIFLNKRVWIAVEVALGVVSWVPLTNEIDAYIHNQSSAATTWTVQHNLKSAVPVVQVYDELHEMVIPDNITPIDADTVEIEFGSAATGSAIIIAGTPEGGVSRNEDPLTYAFEQSFTSSTTVVIPHNLGYYPIIRVFVGNQEIGPATVVHDSIIQATITFSSPQTGVVRLV
jgi:hypothetical protein